jgi:hypothetical protein
VWPAFWHHAKPAIAAAPSSVSLVADTLPSALLEHSASTALPLPPVIEISESWIAHLVAPRHQ